MPGGISHLFININPRRMAYLQWQNVVKILSNLLST